MVYYTYKLMDVEAEEGEGYMEVANTIQEVEVAATSEMIVGAFLV